ncbi:4-coumarate--CoA ligase 1 [Ixodes scapularis]
MKAPIKDGVISSLFPACEIPCCSFYDLAKEQLRAFPDNIVLADRTVSLTGPQVLARMQRYAAGFQANGVLAGHRVCVHLKNSVENFLAMFGCVLAGATVILAKISLTERELHYQMSDGDATHVVTDSTFANKVLNAAKVLQLKGMFVMGEAPGFISASTFSELDEKSYKEVPIEDPRSSVLALTYTSGTTGLPKGVEITHYNIVGAFYTLRSIFGSRSDDVMLAWNPITHSSGLHTVTSVLMGCVNVIASPSMSFEDFVSTISSFKVTGLTFFPSRLQIIVNEMLRSGTRLPTVTSVAVAGGVLTETLAQLTVAAFHNIRSLKNIYGMSECCGCVCVSPVPGISYADVGVPGPTVEIKVRHTLCLCAF